jgi:hypothetical protein
MIFEAKKMLRKPLVSDLIHSFCYACRHKSIWPFVVFGNENAAIGMGLGKTGDLAPFITYALNVQPNYVLAMRQIVLLASRLRNLSVEEQQYAAELMEKYYGIERCTFKASNPNDRLVVQGHEQQELSSSAKLSEYNELFDSE